MNMTDKEGDLENVLPLTNGGLDPPWLQGGEQLVQHLPGSPGGMQALTQALVPTVGGSAGQAIPRGDTMVAVTTHGAHKHAHRKYTWQCSRFWGIHPCRATNTKCRIFMSPSRAIYTQCRVCISSDASAPLLPNANASFSSTSCSKPTCKPSPQVRARSTATPWHVIIYCISQGTHSQVHSEVCILYVCELTLTG